MWACERAGWRPRVARCCSLRSELRLEGAVPLADAEEVLAQGTGCHRCRGKTSTSGLRCGVACHAGFSTRARETRSHCWVGDGYRAWARGAWEAVDESAVGWRCVVGVELRALGPVGAVVNGGLVDLGPPKQRALFALLVSRVGRPVAVDVLLEELWSGDPPAAAMASLLAYVCNLRRVLEPHRAPRAPATVLRTRAPGYLLDNGDAEFDVHRFSGHATAGREALGRGDPQRALSEFDAGLALWRGEAYADVRDAAWVAPEVARLEELRISVVEGRCTALLELGAHEVAVAELEAHVQAHPLREHSCELLAWRCTGPGGKPTRSGYCGPPGRGWPRSWASTPVQRCNAWSATSSPRRRSWTGTRPRCVPTAVAALPRVSATRLAAGRGRRRSLSVGRWRCSGWSTYWPRRAAVAGRVVLVAGEPGIGKTRLLRRFAELAGVPVVWGACPEHVAAPPLWPWEQVLRAVHAHNPDRRVPGPVAELLDGQAPQLAEGSDVAGAALRRFEAIGQYLAADDSPLVVVLDDLHWADLASLRLLAYLADTITASRLLLVGSYRCHESAALAETLAALARAGAGRIELTGLDAEETQALVSAVAGREVSKHTAARLRARTEGNPFFLRELVRLLTSEQRLDQPDTAPVPVPVRGGGACAASPDYPRPRPRCCRWPRSPVGTSTSTSWPSAASVEVEEALEAIDAAVAAGLVVEDQQRLGWFGFTHALVAEALYETTGRLRRVRRHRRIGAGGRPSVGRAHRARHRDRPALAAGRRTRPGHRCPSLGPRRDRGPRGRRPVGPRGRCHLVAASPGHRRTSRRCRSLPAADGAGDLAVPGRESPRRAPDIRASHATRPHRRQSPRHLPTGYRRGRGPVRVELVPGRGRRR